MNPWGQPQQPYNPAMAAYYQQQQQAAYGAYPQQQYQQPAYQQVPGYRRSRSTPTRSRVCARRSRHGAAPTAARGTSSTVPAPPAPRPPQHQ